MLKYGKGELKFSSLTFEDSGMYQCIAENNWGTIYANAELRVVCELPCTYPLKLIMLTAGVYFIIVKELTILTNYVSIPLFLACAPTFIYNPVKNILLGAENGRVVIKCNPRAAPKPKFIWKRGSETLTNSSQ